ncbi:MAG: DNA topoisomerase III, partial [Bacteroidales bacterium]|nr:DNA topoisomerase III [Candidatus Colimorpha onthohippi]
LGRAALTELSIRDGFQTHKPQYDYQRLYEAGMCRAIGYWLLGMIATRLYTLRYRPGRGQVLSIGRVQTPTLALIVNRQLEINNFKPQQYWVLATIYRDTLFSAFDDEDQEGQDATTAIKRSQEEWQQIFDAIRLQPFTITAVSTKKGTEAPPRLFDLTGLQVECNKKFGFSADETLRYIQSLYEKKLTTYPRVDTTYLSDDIYPKCPQILMGLQPYAPLVQPLMSKPLNKSKKVFDSSKVTDHHAIIPTGVNPANGDVTLNEKKVYDLVARRFIAAFYPDCQFLSTKVTGSVPIDDQRQQQFKATGKQITDPGWHVVFPQKKSDATDESKKPDDDQVLPEFKKGESGPHTPTLTEKWTTPPKPYTEASLLRAMETAGKFVENEELRDALKENGIGRPSTRAAIIETLFKRGYIQKERKNLIATPTGIDLIKIIREELLKSAELTGQWEKKLREIELHKYDSQQFINELKQMVWDIVQQVKSDPTDRRVAAPAPTTNSKGNESKESASKKAKPRTPRKKKTTTAVSTPPKEGDICPVCGKGHVIKGKTALGCSEWRNGCTARWQLEP